MKVNNKILSIPPYISTAWGSINSLLMQGQTLFISLKDGTSVEIPGLEPVDIETIFQMHATVLELQNKEVMPTSNALRFFSPGQILNAQNLNQPEQNPIEIPLRFAVGNMDQMGSVFEHNPAQADMPPIPGEILEKIMSVIKLFSPEEAISCSTTEPHCNCVHCQLGRATESNTILVKEDEKTEEEIVNEKDLTFQQWDIVQSGNQLYTVTNRLDAKEKYSVYLGHPIGCTCGHEGCEHVIAVLKT